MGRVFATSIIRDRSRLGPGSVWLGSWWDISGYKTKTLGFNVGNKGTSGGGSIAIITGLSGTGIGGMTGTFYGPVRVGKGTPTLVSFTDAVKWVRPWIRQHGSNASGITQHGGTVSVHLGRQV